MAKKNDPYAICTAQKKKSGMGHDEWKRCVKKLQKKESVMNFYERAAKLINEVETASQTEALSPEQLAKTKKWAEKGRGIVRGLKTSGDATSPEEKEAQHRKDQAKQDKAADRELNASKKSKLKKKPRVKEVFSDDHLDKVQKEVGVTPAQSAAAKEKVKKEREAEKALNGSKKSKLKKKKKTTDKPLPAKKESFYERMGDLLNELAVTASKKKKKGKKKVDDDAVRTTLDQETIDAKKAAAEDEEEAETGQAVEAKKGDKDWIQKAVNPKHKGYCTPMTKATCTPARKALAKRFKKAGRKEKKSGGTGWQGKV